MSLPDDEELTREVYALFGLAYYMSECVYQGLVNVFAALRFTPTDATRPRIEERMKVAEQMTLGDLVSETRALLPPELHSSIDWALAQRNALAHGFWYQRVHMMGSDEGKRELVGELDSIARTMSGLSDSLDIVVFDHLRNIGATDAQIEACFREAAQNPVAPWPARRVPRTEERIEIREAWVAGERGEDGLMFRDAEGHMWQLCDAGLGWCYHTEPGPTWRPAAKLKGRLPAMVVARPRNAKPWEYKLHVATGALICVERDSNAGRFRWRIEIIP